MGGEYNFLTCNYILIVDEENMGKRNFVGQTALLKDETFLCGISNVFDKV